MITGSLPNQLVPHSITLMDSLSNDNVVGSFTGTRTKIECLKVLVILLERIKDILIPGICTLSNILDVKSRCRASLAQLSSGCKDNVIIDLAKRGMNALI